MAAALDSEKRPKPRCCAEPKVSPAELSARPQRPGAGAGLPLFMRRAGPPSGTGARANLTVSQPGDPYERHADLVAERVMRDASPAGVCTACSGGAGPCPRCAGESAARVRRKEGGAHGPDATAVAARPSRGLEGRGGGRPLDAAARAFFEPRFGRDLSGVRVHTGGQAGASAKSLNALAYTVGHDIVFGEGQYDAGSQTGRRLLAHELTHVIQQDFGSGLSDGVVRRQPDPQGQSEPGAQPAIPVDPREPIPLPPEHEERVARLEEMAKDIELGEQAREELQAQVRNMAVSFTTEEEEAERDDLKAQLTWREENLVAMLEERIVLIDDSVAALQHLLPGVTPSPPHEPNASGVPAPDASVQSEISRLSHERFMEASRATLLKRCLARKKIRQIEAQLAELPQGPSLEVAELEGEKQKQLDFLKTSASGISCAKPPGQARHPTEVSPAAFKKMKLGEGFVSTPYVALEGEKTGKGGCTIGYGHVITALDEGRTCEHAPGPEPPSRTVEPGQEVPAYMMKLGNRLYRRCECTPDWVLSQAQAVELAKKDVGVAIRWVKQNVLVDLDQGQFDALVDITLAVGSVPQSLLDALHSKLCVDDEAVRQQYMKTALYTKDNRELGPIHAKRRKERVWAPKGDDPTCV